MNTYNISWTEEMTFSINVKAKSREEATNKFMQGDTKKVTMKDVIDSNLVEESLEVEDI